jgi:hypothetical protein
MVLQTKQSTPNAKVAGWTPAGPPITSNKYVGLVLIGTQGYVEIINLLRYQPWCGSARLRFALHVILD